MYRKKRLCLQGVRHHENRGILVYSNCLISISKSVSHGAANKSFLNIESHSKIANEYEPDVLNTFCAIRVQKKLKILTNNV